MSLIELFLTQECVITPFLRDYGAEPVYGEPERRKCRLERGKTLRHVYKDPNGALDENTGGAKLFCVGEPIPTRSLVVCDGVEYVVLGCDIKNGFTDSHLEVTMQ